MKKILTLTLMALMTLSVAHAQTADAIAKKYVEAIGGAAKWKALKSTKLTITLNQQGFDIPGYILADNQNRERFELEFNGMKMIQANDGETAWGMNQFMGQTSPAKLEGAEAEAAKNTEFLDEFIDYKKRGYSISLEGETGMEGKSCYKIKLTKADGDDTIYYFDKETGLMVAEEVEAQGQMVMMVVSDYSEVEGLNMPMKIAQKASGATLLTITINKVEFNVETANDNFAFPGN